MLVLPRACADRFFSALRMTGQDYSGTGVRRIAATRAEGMSPSVAFREKVWTPGESILAQPNGYQAYALVASCSFTTAS